MAAQFLVSACPLRVLWRFLDQSSVVENLSNGRKGRAGQHSPSVQGVAAQFTPNTASPWRFLTGSRPLLTPCVEGHFTTDHCFGVQCGPVSMLEVSRGGRVLQGKIPDSSNTDIIIFALSRQAAVLAFSGSNGACNLIFFRGTLPPLWFGAGRGLG